MTIQTRPFTAEELLRRPDDGWRHEQIRGWLKMTVPAGVEHCYLPLDIAS